MIHNSNWPCYDSESQGKRNRSYTAQHRFVFSSDAVIIQELPHIMSHISDVLDKIFTSIYFQHITSLCFNIIWLYFLYWNYLPHLYIVANGLVRYIKTQTHDIFLTPIKKYVQDWSHIYSKLSLWNKISSVSLSYSHNPLIKSWPVLNQTFLIVLYCIKCG